VARPKGGKSEGAKRTTIYLNPQEDFALSLIENSRRIRKDKRYQPSDIVADALWLYAEQVEGKTREQIAALLPAMPEEKQQSNLTPFPKKGKRKSS
jgi:hypothetical protein